jgi:hypothetical protein
MIWSRTAVVVAPMRKLLVLVVCLLLIGEDVMCTSRLEANQIG